MKSIKPGRMTSFQGFVGSIIAIVFGIFWLFLVTSFMFENEDIPQAIFFAFAFFGVVFIVIGIVNAVVEYKNAFSKNRYSLLDVVDSSEEQDPFHFKNNTTKLDTINYCPHCGTSIQKEYNFCPGCGTKLK